MGKYVKGEQIKDPMLAAALIMNGQPVFDRYKCQNAAWMINQSLRTIVGLYRSGNLCFAIKKEKDQ